MSKIVQLYNFFLSPSCIKISAIFQNSQYPTHDEIHNFAFFYDDNGHGISNLLHSQKQPLHEQQHEGGEIGQGSARL